jgi:hypothetical protein
MYKLITKLELLRLVTFLRSSCSIRMGMLRYSIKHVFHFELHVLGGLASSKSSASSST